MMLVDSLDIRFIQKSGKICQTVEKEKEKKLENIYAKKECVQIDIKRKNDRKTTEQRYNNSINHYNNSHFNGGVVWM